MQIIRIAARKDGFRRCGLAHSASPTDYPSDRFSSEVLDQLKAEPMLVVQELDRSDAAPEESKKDDAGKSDKGKKAKSGDQPASSEAA